MILWNCINKKNRCKAVLFVCGYVDMNRLLMPVSEISLAIDNIPLTVHTVRMACIKGKHIFSVLD